MTHRQHSDSGDYTYTTRPGDLRQFDLRTAPDRLQAYCDALDRRVETLEQAATVNAGAMHAMQEAIMLLLDQESERLSAKRVEQLERGLLDAGHRISVLERRIALLEDAEVRT